MTQVSPRWKRICGAGAGWLLLALNAVGCGLLTDTETLNGEPPVILHAQHLPQLLRFIELGSTTPERVQAEFPGQHLYVVSTVGREQRVTELGANTGRRYANVSVTRQERDGAPVGELGDDFTLTFEFTSFDADGEGPLRLFAVHVTQPLSAPSVCPAAQELAIREGLEECHPDGVHPPAAPNAEGYFHACVYNEDDLPVEVRCAPSQTGDARHFTVTVTLGRLGEVADAPGDAPPEATAPEAVAPEPAAPEAAAPEAVPEDAPPQGE